MEQKEHNKVYIYYKNVGIGYELIGDTIISGMDSFYGNKDAYLIEHCNFEDNLFVYHWDNSQKKRKTVYDKYTREQVLVGLIKDVDDITEHIKKLIFDKYLAEELALEAENNAI
jgi:hypothetical protein